MTNEITIKNVRNALVMHNPNTAVSGGNRWYDAFGPGVVKYLQNFSSLPADDQTTDPTEFVNTVVEVGAGVSTAVLGDVAGGALIITTAANEDDGYSMQLGNPNSGENVQLNGTDYKTYFGIRFQGNDVDQSDFFFGLAVTDTALLGGVTDGIFFRSVDATGVINFVLEQDSVETTTAVGTLVDDTYMTCEFYHDGSNVMVYVNGSLVTTIADTDDNFPDDEILRLSMEFLTGEAVANTCQVDWVRLIHIRN